MEYSTDFVRTRINTGHEGELVRWARLLDASPDEIRGAIQCAGTDFTAVRDFLSSRQLRLFDSQAVEIAARSARAASL